MKSNLSKICLIILLFVLFAFITINSYATSVFNEISQNVFRLHILANSDSKEDQELKLKVRDNIIEYLKYLNPEPKNKSEIISLVEDNIDKLKKISMETIKENGYDYKVKIEIGNFYFPTKYYGNISLPAGNYDAIRIKIGEAKGQNWWCSLFPSLCFTDVSNGKIDRHANNNLKENLGNEEYEIITNNSKNIKFKFKLIEMFNKLK